MAGKESVIASPPATVVIRDCCCSGFKKALQIRRQDPFARIVVLDAVPPREYRKVAGRGAWEAGLARSKHDLACQYELEHRQGVEVTAVDHQSRVLEIREHTGRTYQEHFDAFVP